MTWGLLASEQTLAKTPQKRLLTAFYKLGGILYHPMQKKPLKIKKNMKTKEFIKKVLEQGKRYGSCLSNGPIITHEHKNGWRNTWSIQSRWNGRKIYIRYNKTVNVHGYGYRSVFDVMKYGEKDCNLDLMFQSYDMLTDIEATANAIDRYFLH